MAARSLYRALAQALAELEIKHVFGVMGEDTAALTVGIIERGIRYLGARHESVAVGMADGYSWASGGLGVCMVTRGPGVMNATTALRTAVQGRRQLLLITGDAPTAGERAFDYKYIDQQPLADAIGMRYFVVSEPAGAFAALEQAVASAADGRPAMLVIPADVFYLDAPDTTFEPAAPIVARAPEPPLEDALAQMLQILRGSRRPLILAGRGAATAATVASLERLAELTGALLGTTLLAKDLFRGNRLDLGVVGSFASDPAAGLLAELDCVLAFGARLTPFTTAQRTLFQNAPVIQIDSDPASIGATFPIALGVLADAGATAARLVELLEREQPTDDWPFHAPESLARLRSPLYDGPDESEPHLLDPRVVAAALDRLLAQERSVVLDSGRFMTSPSRFLRVPGPRYFRLTADAGSIALGLGVALGAAVARPEAANVLFVGDGGLSMHVGDLETAARHSIPLVIVVMNDSAYGSEWVHLEGDGLPTRYAGLPTIDFASVARSLGVEAASATVVDDLEQLGPLLQGRTSPLLIDCSIRQDLTAARLRWPQPQTLGV
jgi:thiamine pyrophosphate-dependent acetolactate synthase large subunit-like protein